MSEKELIVGSKFTPDGIAPIWPAGVYRVSKIGVSKTNEFICRMHDGSEVSIKPGWRVVYDDQHRRVGVTDGEGTSLVLDEVKGAVPICGFEDRSE